MDDVRPLRIVNRGCSGMGEVPHGVSMNRKLSVLEYIKSSASDQLPKYLIGPIEDFRKYLKRQDAANLPFLLNDRLKIVDDHGQHNLLTPLGYALWQNDFELVKLLLNTCADCDQKPCVRLDDNPGNQTYDYETPLHMSTATFCDPKIVRTLLEWSGSSEDFSPEVIESVICYVTQYSAIDEDLIQHLLQKVPSVNLQCKNSGKGALHMAVSSNNRRCLELLLDRNADVDCLSRSLKTPLIMACEKNRTKLVEILLQRGANVNFSDAVGRTALHYAVRLSTQESVDLLLKAGANIKVETNRGLTPLDYIFVGKDQNGGKLLRKDPRENKGVLLESFLLHSKHSFSLEECHFDDAAHEMMESGESEEAVQKLLIEHKEHFQKRLRKQSSTETFVHLAAKFHKPQTLEWLINHKMKVSDKDADGFLPIHCAFSSGALPCAELLLKNGADVNSKTTQGWTPMWLGLRYGHVDLVSQFIQYGADISSSIKIRLLQQAQTHLKLPLTLFDPDKMREDPRGFAVSANLSISLVEYTIHANFYRITRLLLQAGAPITTTARGGLIIQAVDVLKFQKLITDKLKEEEALPKSADGRTQRIHSLNKLGQLVNKQPTLKELGRFVVRKMLGNNIPGKVSDLRLPKDLADFIGLFKSYDSMRGVTFSRIPSN